MKTTIQHIKILAITLLTAMAALSCQPDWTDSLEPDLSLGNMPASSRTPNEETRKVMLLYSAGFNSISSYLKADIEDLKKGWIPYARRPEDIILVYSHFPSKDGYKTQTPSYLVRLYMNREDEVISDTLQVYPAGTISASAQQLNTVLTYVRDNFQAKSYGMIFSSHATGYLPTGYYNKPQETSDDLEWKSRRRRGATSAPYIEPEYDPSMPMVKSIGQDQVGQPGSYESYEIELSDFAEAIPMHLDYLLFDACLMGGVEVAYELKDKVSRVGFSQTEVLAEGYCYESLAHHLLGSEESDPRSVCEDFYNQYAEQSGLFQSATISLVDCANLQPLASVCKDLFGKYSEQISALEPSKVQKFFRSGKHWFYDLESILINAGITAGELKSLHEALDKCIIYKAHTPKFMSEFEIHTFSGFSMYLPSHGSKYLDSFYKTLKWNQDTGLVN